MASKIKVDNINKVSDDSTIIKKCGSTTTVGSGAGNTIVVCGATVTIGRCGGSVALASGASQTGFGSPGQVVDWQTSDIKTSTFTAEADKGYFINSGSAITMNLPAGSAGDVVAVSDYARNFETYNFTISPNGSQKIGGVNGDAILSVNSQAATFVYVDSTKGWVNVQNTEKTETGLTGFIMATGGTMTTCGNDTLHTFTGPGTFCVQNVSPVAANNQVSYMVVAGGGAGGGSHGGGGGGGGFREDSSPTAPYTGSPLVGAGDISIPAAAAYPITVGAGGAGGSGPLNNGSDSVFSTITSAGGGVGGSYGPTMQPQTLGGSGGGGGGGPACQTGASGNTPPVSPPQGNNGGNGVAGSRLVGGGGGGAGAAGTSATPSGAGAGGAGIATSINGTPTLRSGGGGGGGAAPSYPGAAGGPGGGGAGGTGSLGAFGTPGTANTGGGGGGGNTGDAPGGHGGSGGSGIVIIRYKTS
jgi:hypothetical protein